MGEAELNHGSRVLTIFSHWILYGGAADQWLADLCRDETQELWNEPRARVTWKNRDYLVEFRITATYKPETTQMEVLQSTDPRVNYFRVEDFVHGNISFVDGIGCNTGYFKRENLYEGSTTAAHEYGHTLGLVHPRELDIRGSGVPGIMYPRGTLVDAQFQYDPTVLAGRQGGTMHPKFRKVRQEDIDLLKLHRLSFVEERAVVGAFTNIFHWDHATLNPSAEDRPRGPR